MRETREMTSAIPDPQKLLSFLRDTIDLEEKIVRAAEKNTRELKSIFVKELLGGIALDSMKHANILRGMIAMVAGPAPFLTEEEMSRLKEGISEHIELEAEAIGIYEDLLKKAEEEKMRFLIDYILTDERRHHELLKSIEKVIIEAETLTEEDMWDLFWKYSVFHGAPGG